MHIGISADLELVDRFCCLGDMLSLDRGTDTEDQSLDWMEWVWTVGAVACQWDVSLMVGWRLCSGCVRGGVLHGSRTWPMGEESGVVLRRAEIRMVRWMCSVKLQDSIPSKGLRERLGLDDIVSVLQQNKLRWCGHVL